MAAPRVRLKRSSGEDESALSRSASSDSFGAFLDESNLNQRRRVEPFRVRLLGYAPAMAIMGRALRLTESVALSARSTMSYLRGWVHEREVCMMGVNPEISNTQLLLQPFPDLEERTDAILLCVSPDSTCYSRQGIAADICADRQLRETAASKRTFEAQIIKNLSQASPLIRSTPVVVVNCGSPNNRDLAVACRSLLALCGASMVLTLSPTDTPAFWKELFAAPRSPLLSLPYLEEANRIISGTAAGVTSSSLVDMYLGDEVTDKQIKAAALLPEDSPRRTVLLSTTEGNHSIDLPILQHHNPIAIGNVVVSRFRRQEAISQAVLTRVLDLFFNPSTPPPKFAYIALCDCLQFYGLLSPAVFNYFLDYQMFGTTRRLFKRLGAQVTASCVPLTSALKAAVFIALFKEEFPTSRISINEADAATKPDGWRLLALRPSHTSSAQSLLPFCNPPSLVQLVVNHLLFYLPLSYGGSPASSSSPTDVASPLSASSITKQSIDERLGARSIERAVWLRANLPQTPHFSFLHYAPEDVLPRYLALLQVLHDAIPFNYLHLEDAKVLDSSQRHMFSFYYNAVYIQLVLPTDMSLLQFYISGHLLLDTSQEVWFTTDELAPLTDAFVSIGLSPEDLWPFLVVVLNWISYGSSPKEVLFPPILFASHHPPPPLPRAPWWHHLVSPLSPFDLSLLPRPTHVVEIASQPPTDELDQLHFTRDDTFHSIDPYLNEMGL